MAITHQHHKEIYSYCQDPLHTFATQFLIHQTSLMTDAHKCPCPFSANILHKDHDHNSSNNDAHGKERYTGIKGFFLRWGDQFRSL